MGEKKKEGRNAGYEGVEMFLLFFILKNEDKEWKEKNC